MRLASARRLLSPSASGPCSGGTSRYSPHVARSSQPLRRRDAITWSAALVLPPSRSTISARVASRRPRSLSASTTLLSCVDKDRVMGSMSFSVTKPPEKGGFVAKYCNPWPVLLISFWRETENGDVKSGVPQFFLED